MKRTLFRSVVISSAVLLAASVVHARTRPRCGETVRAETRTAAPVSDNTPSALVGTVFETLVIMDDSGHVRPALATSWVTPNGGSRWEFLLRRGVVLHDGTALT